MNTGLNTTKPRLPMPYIRFVSVKSVVKKVWKVDARGVFGRMHELFGERMDALIDELNKELTA